MNERRKTGSLPLYNIMHRWGVSCLVFRQTQSWTCLLNFVGSFPLQAEHGSPVAPKNWWSVGLCLVLGGTGLFWASFWRLALVVEPMSSGILEQVTPIFLTRGLPKYGAAALFNAIVASLLRDLNFQITFWSYPSSQFNCPFWLVQAVHLQGIKLYRRKKSVSN